MPPNYGLVLYPSGSVLQMPKTAFKQHRPVLLALFITGTFLQVPCILKTPSQNLNMFRIRTYQAGVIFDLQGDEINEASLRVLCMSFLFRVTSLMRTMSMPELDSVIRQRYGCFP